MAVLVWLVFALVSHGVVDLAGRRHGHGRYGHHHLPSEWTEQGCVSASELASTSETDDSRHVRQPSHRAQALAKYALPVDTGLVLSSQSRWPHSGSVYVYEDATLGREDQQTKVDVFVNADSLSGLDSTEVCWWTGPFGENHIAVKVCGAIVLTAETDLDFMDVDIRIQGDSSWFNDIFNKRPQVEIHVRLPPPASHAAPTYISSLEMDLPSFSPTIGDLQGSYEFGLFKHAFKPGIITP